MIIAKRPRRYEHSAYWYILEFCTGISIKECTGTYHIYRLVGHTFYLKKLEVARSRRPPLPEIVLWIAASRSPSESQTSECSDLLSRSRATFVIVAQRQPGKLLRHHQVGQGHMSDFPRCRFSVDRHRSAPSTGLPTSFGHRLALCWRGS